MTRHAELAVRRCRVHCSDRMLAAKNFGRHAVARQVEFALFDT